MVKIKTALLCDSDVRTTTLHTYYENLVFLTIWPFRDIWRPTNFLACRSGKMEMHCIFTSFWEPISALDHVLPTERTLERALNSIFSSWSFTNASPCFRHWKGTLDDTLSSERAPYHFVMPTLQETLSCLGVLTHITVSVGCGSHFNFDHNYNKPNWTTSKM